MIQERLPWAQIQALMSEMHEYYTLMQQFEQNVERRQMPIEIAELLYVNPIKQINSSSGKILRDNQVKTDEEREQQKRIEEVIESIVKIQNEIVDKAENSRIEMLIYQTRTSIINATGGVVTQKTENLLEVFQSNFECIENRFSQLKQSILEQGEEVVNTLRNEIRARNDSLIKGNNQIVSKLEVIEVAATQKNCNHKINQTNINSKKEGMSLESDSQFHQEETKMTNKI